MSKKRTIKKKISKASIKRQFTVGTVRIDEIKGNGQFVLIKPNLNTKHSGRIGYVVEHLWEGDYINFGKDFEGNDEIVYHDISDMIFLSNWKCKPFEPIDPPIGWVEPNDKD